MSNYGWLPIDSGRRQKVALLVILLLAGCYTLLFALYLPEPMALIAGFLPGILAVGVLFWSGKSRQDCGLIWGPLSWRGAAVLTAVTLLMLPVIGTGLSGAGWRGLDWIQGLVYAPASGIAQELYYRAALLPGLKRLAGWSSRWALIASSAIFALYHAGMFLVAPAWVASAALLVTFLAGLGWGWQTQRDGTVIWAMAHHAVLQALLRMFAWG